MLDLQICALMDHYDGGIDFEESILSTDLNK